VDAKDTIRAMRAAWAGMVQAAAGLDRNADAQDIENLARSYATAADVSWQSVRQKVRAVRHLLYEDKKSPEEIVRLGQEGALKAFSARNKDKYEGRTFVRLDCVKSQKELLQEALERICKAAGITNREHLGDLLLASFLDITDDYWRELAQERKKGSAP
jgi:hypothetical protein